MRQLMNYFAIFAIAFNSTALAQSTLESLTQAEKKAQEKVEERSESERRKDFDDLIGKISKDAAAHQFEARVQFPAIEAAAKSCISENAAGFASRSSEPAETVARVVLYRCREKITKVIGTYMVAEAVSAGAMTEVRRVIQNHWAEAALAAVVERRAATLQ